jgi:hypothetical protein
MAYRFNDESELREAFWQEHPQFAMRGNGRQNQQPADTRAAFVDWIDYLERNDEISEELAEDATL